MKSFNSNIKNLDAFASFKSTLEDAGAVVDGSVICFEADNSNARMLVESLIEYDIASPLMEAVTDPNAAKDMLIGKVDEIVNNVYRSSSEPLRAKIAQAVKKIIENAVSSSPDVLTRAATALEGNDVKGLEKIVHSTVNALTATDSDFASQVGAADDAQKGPADELVAKTLEKLGLDADKHQQIVATVKNFIQAKAEANPDYFNYLTRNPPTLAKLVFTAIQKEAPDLYEQLKTSGKLKNRNDTTASMAGKQSVDDIKAELMRVLNQVEVPSALVLEEEDDSEADKAVVTAYGFPMINLTSTLVREMLRAQDPSAQKRAYKVFKKQLKADPDIASALSMGIGGMLGVRGSGQSAGRDTGARIDASVPEKNEKTEAVGQDGNPLMEGLLTTVKNAFKSPIDILKAIAQNKGTPCLRNNLVVMYDDIAGMDSDSNNTVKATPLGVSAGIFTDLNQQVQVPASHLAKFYSVLDPKKAFGSYAKAMAEVNTKRNNAKKDAALATGNKKAAEDLAKYFVENGHPPFYLLKPKSEPKEIARWCDEDMSNGFNMIFITLEDHKFGMVVKEDVAKALFRVG